MPITDPEVLAFIAATAEFSAPGGAPDDVAGRRRGYDAMCAAFRMPRPPGVTVEDTAADAVPVRIYSPPSPRPGATLYFHGGGFVVGSLDSHDDVCAELAARTGSTVVAVDYRLAPEHVHPAEIDDAEAAWRFARARFGDLVVAGDSAGATITVALALRTRRRGDPPAVGHVLIYPLLADGGLPAHTEHADAPMLTAADLVFFRAARLGGRVPDPADEAHPLETADVTGMPPTVVVAADVDPLRDDGPVWGREARRRRHPRAMAQPAGAAARLPARPSPQRPRRRSVRPHLQRDRRARPALTPRLTARRAAARHAAPFGIVSRPAGPCPRRQGEDAAPSWRSSR